MDSDVQFCVRVRTLGFCGKRSFVFFASHEIDFVYFHPANKLVCSQITSDDLRDETGFQLAPDDFIVVTY